MKLIELQTENNDDNCLLLVKIFGFNLEKKLLFFMFFLAYYL